MVVPRWSISVPASDTWNPLFAADGYLIDEGHRVRIVSSADYISCGKARGTDVTFNFSPVLVGVQAGGFKFSCGRQEQLESKMMADRVQCYAAISSIFHCIAVF